MPKIVLRDELAIEYTYTGDTNWLEHTFVEYKVESGKWILYIESDYNPTADSSDNILKVDGPTTGFQSLPFSPRSLRNFEETANSCILFEHRNYCGRAQTYKEACPDVGADFTTTVTGKSSLIIWKKKDWILFELKGYQGGSRTLNPEWYPSLEDQGLKSVGSLKPVDPQQNKPAKTAQKN